MFAAGFFYLKHMLSLPLIAGSQPGMGIIDAAITSLGGRTLEISAPADFAKAIAAVQRTR
jgi:hypothetical protein